MFAAIVMHRVPAGHILLCAKPASLYLEWYSSMTLFVLVVLGLDDRNRNVRLVIENVIGAFGLAASVQLATDDDATFGEGDLFADLGVQVPAGSDDGWCDVFAANVALCQLLLIQDGSLFWLG